MRVDFTPEVHPHRYQPVNEAIATWLQDVSIDDVIRLWYVAQGRKAERQDIHQERLSDPNDCYGKSAEWVEAYYARKVEHGRISSPPR